MTWAVGDGVAIDDDDDGVALLGVDKVRPVCVSGVVGNREIPKPTVGGAARVDTEVQRA